jgi:beta-glucuronidase
VPNIRVSDVTITTDVKGSTGIVDYTVVTEGTPDKVEVELVDEEGVSVGSYKGLYGSISIPKAHLWQPGAAYLYVAKIRLSKDSSVVDEYSVNVGIRTVRVSGLEILINEKPFYFKGFGKHEDTPIKGKGHDDAWMVHDFELMKWCGANSFRTSHYPYSTEWMDYADRHGWVIIDETPAVGLNLSIGGGIFGGGEKRNTFSEDFAGKATQAAHKDAIRELIQRDKNHPSVILWCITNEPDSSGPGAREYFEPLVKFAREADPSRPLTYTNVMFVKPEQELIADLFDVIGLNRYYGWYEDNGDLASAERKLEDELNRFQAKFKRPLLMLEYGSDTLAGLHSVGDLPWSEEYQAKMYDMYHRVFDRVEAMQGEQVWNMADFSTSNGIFRVDGNKKGAFTRDRRPKAGAHALRRRWHEKI